MNDDSELLRRFADETSDASFRELVIRRIDFVYAAALHQVEGDSHLAQEIAQSVFLDLACKAKSLATRPTITGWLYTSVRFAAAKVRRSRARRLNHESEAHSMQEILAARPVNEFDWNEVRPVIDAALHELGEHASRGDLAALFRGAIAGGGREGHRAG